MTEQNEGIHTQRVVELRSSDLPLHCPLPQDSSWNAHPRVYLPIEKTGEALCPYCGTYYKLIGGPVRNQHSHS